MPADIPTNTSIRDKGLRGNMKGHLSMNPRCWQWGYKFYQKIFPPFLKISFPQKFFNLIHWNKGNKWIFVFKGRKTWQSIFIPRTKWILKLIFKQILYRILPLEFFHLIVKYIVIAYIYYSVIIIALKRI